ncbi:uncharacterized protein [Amphiura filiformis]|uniref:uncharacterized protein n=1 Tax=Amphiura filiformis TaxID=82378 RepID=UPI003B2206AE
MMIFFCENPVTKPDGIDCGKTVHNLKQNEIVSVKTPNYPNAYPVDAECNWIFTGPPNSAMCVGFTHEKPGSSLESQVDNGEIHCWDFIEAFISPYLTIRTTRYCGDDMAFYHVFPLDDWADFFALMFKSDDYDDGSTGVKSIVLFVPPNTSDDECRDMIKKSDKSDNSLQTIQDEAVENDDFYYYYDDYYYYYYG